jgi:hypothetical protein
VGGEGISGELGIGEVITKTFEIYRRNFSKFLILFLTVGIVEGVPATIIDYIYDDPRFLGVYIPFLIVTLALSLILDTIIFGSAVKMTSDYFERGRVELGVAVRFAASKWIPLLIVTVLVGTIVVLGTIALIIPGMILGIMFSLVIPAVIIESSRVTKAMDRSRELVGHRWLKTFGFLLVVGAIGGVSVLVTGEIGGLFDGAKSIVISILSAFYVPLIPIALTVYYYSNKARLTPPRQMPQ